MRIFVFIVIRDISLYFVYVCERERQRQTFAFDIWVWYWPQIMNFEVFLCFLEKFIEYWYHLFLKCLIELISEAILTWAFLCRKNFKLLIHFLVIALFRISILESILIICFSGHRSFHISHLICWMLSSLTFSLNYFGTHASNAVHFSLTTAIVAFHILIYSVFVIIWTY